MITVICILMFVLALAIFVQVNAELWEEMGDDLKSTVNDWYKSTRLYMWINNKKNKVTILSDRQYRILQRTGKLRDYIIIDRRNEK